MQLCLPVFDAFIRSTHRFRIAQWTLVFSVTALGQTAIAQNLPPAAMPGAQPEETRRESPGVAPLVIPAGGGQGETVDVEAGPSFAVSVIEIVERLGPGAGQVSSLDDPALAGIAESYLERHDGQLTFGHLVRLAEELTTRLRRADFLATAYVPQQTVEGERVRIEVLRGRLGAIDVVRGSGQRIYRDSDVSQPFEGLVDEVVDEDRIIDALLRLREYPGLDAGVTFSRGDRLGETRMFVRINEEQRFGVNVFADNYGSDFTGRFRYGARFDVNNPMKLRDRLTVQLVQVEPPDNTSFDSPSDRTYGSVRYSTNVLLDGLVDVGLELYSNRYSVGDVGEDNIGRLGVHGESQGTRAFGTLKWIRRLDTSLDFDVALNMRQAKTFTGSAQSAQDDLASLEVGLTWRQNDMIASELLGGGGQNLVSVRLVRGIEGALGAMDNRTSVAAGELAPSRRVQLSGGGTGFAPADYNKMEFQLLRQQPVIHDWFSGYVRLVLAGQFSGDPLYSVEQYGLGGPFNVRAYPVASFLADEGTFASAEFGFSPVMPSIGWVDDVDFKAFFDWGGGSLNQPLPNERRSVNLRGFGFGLDYAWRRGSGASGPVRGVDVSASMAWAMGSGIDVDIQGEVIGGQQVFGRDTPDRDEPMIYFRLSTWF